MSNEATRQYAISEESCPPPFLIELAAARPDELLYIHIAQCKNCCAGSYAWTLPSGVMDVRWRYRTSANGGRRRRLTCLV